MRASVNLCVELEGAAQPVERARVVAEPVRGVAETGGGVGRVGVGGGGQVEEAVRRTDQPFAEECAADLEHELVIVLKAELEDALERAGGTGTIAQLEQRLAQTGETILVIGIETEGLIEAPPRPGVLLAGEVGVGPADVEFDSVRIEGDALIQDGQRLIIAAFVVELMGLFVEVVGAEECIRHRQASRMLVAVS